MTLYWVYTVNCGHQYAAHRCKNVHIKIKIVKNVKNVTKFKKKPFVNVE